MKYRLFNKTFFSIAALSTLLLTSCLKKNDTTYLDFSQLQDQVILRTGGLANFKGANLRVDNTSATPDSIQLYAQLASVNASGSDVKVGIAVDNGQIATYNSANGTKFQAFPAGSYKLVSTALTITAGNHYASTYVILDQTKFDPTVSYMLPVSITDGAGKALSANQNTIFYNIIGNPIAGNYKWDFTRWSNSTAAGAPDANTFTNHTTTLVADDPTTVEVKSGYFIGPRYVISFTNTNGVLGNVKVSFNPSDATDLVNGGVTVTDGPNVVKADFAKGEFVFQYATLTRYVIDRYYK